MAYIKNTNITQGTIKTLTIVDGNTIVSSGTSETTITDSENTISTSYLPTGTGYLDVELFEDSVDIEIGKRSDSSKRTEMIINRSSETLFQIKSELGENNASLTTRGYKQSTTYTLGAVTYTDPIFDKKSEIKVLADQQYVHADLNFYVSDNTNPDNISQIINISPTLTTFNKDINLFRGLMVDGHTSFTRYTGGNTNLVIRNKIIIAENEDYNPSTSGYYYYEGESGICIMKVQTGHTDIRKTTTYLGPGAGIGSSYDRYRHKFYSSTFDNISFETDYAPGMKGWIALREPGTSSTFNSWYWYNGFRFRSPYSKISYLGTGIFGEQMNFTGQHRNASKDSLSEYDNRVGLIVVSTGTYKDLNSNNSITINEALPVICLADKRKQKNVLGVVSDKEDENLPERKVSLSGWKFKEKKETGEEKARVIINSVGEGAIWVCNINGNLENGDYITSCEIAGYGMKQDEARMANYTVAKITCDCDFDLNSPIYMCEEFEWQGQTYRRAFVGCTYHCG